MADFRARSSTACSSSSSPARSASPWRMWSEAGECPHELLGKRALVVASRGPRLGLLPRPTHGAHGVNDFRDRVQDAIARGRSLASTPNTCDEAQARWDDRWIRCPVCGCMANEDGHWVHKDPKDVLQ